VIKRLSFLIIISKSKRRVRRHLWNTKLWSSYEKSFWVWK